MKSNIALRLGHILRRLDLDSDSGAARAGAFRVGEVEARGRAR